MGDWLALKDPILVIWKWVQKWDFWLIVWVFLRLFHLLSCWLQHFTFVPEMQSFTSSWPWPLEFCFVSSWESALWSFTLARFVHLHTPFKEVYSSPPPILYHIIYSWTKKVTSLLNCHCAVCFPSSVLVILTWIFAMLWTLLSNQRDLVYYHKHLWQSHPSPNNGLPVIAPWISALVLYLLWMVLNFLIWGHVIWNSFFKNVISYRFFKVLAPWTMRRRSPSSDFPNGRYLSTPTPCCSSDVNSLFWLG